MEPLISSDQTLFDTNLPDPATLSTWAQQLGFDAVAVTDVDLSAHEPHVRDWLAKGFAGDMGYLHRNLDKRLHPELLETETCRVISARMNYLPADTQPIKVLENSTKAYVSRYALGRDYHKILRKRLATLATKIDHALPGHRYRAFTDSAPVLEKALAEKAGLGWMGKHTLLLHKEVGSWFFLGEIYTNAPLVCSTETVADACGKCSACMTVCPTQAIVGPKKLDARRCISYLTIEHKGSIDPELRDKMGNRIYGCDDCQLFCPWNRDAATTKEPDFAPRHNLDNRELIDLFGLTAEEYDTLTLGSAMRRVSYAQWQRNLAIAIGNGPSNQQALAALQKQRGKVNAMVDEHIVWAQQKLSRHAKEPLINSEFFK
ncbi:MAG: tRNA epoxyqueuosine(34) reductase QueG [Proteobacteria bacterium]|nr:tRNA epoxyqueuosine(34) reductase QueG [Pseudomonadota bacterium]